MELVEQYKIPLAVSFWIVSMLYCLYKCERHKVKKQPPKTKLYYKKYNVYY